ncbi:zinc finger protein 724-like isoform X2 [Odontomachus brunneus]|uniref:zinc finger protein 724-like isoform X2 n=1 Tax=Odontomachus brunneus TaxID=486640 RepID=UPI0013F29B1C|nr:zinc finger protein 724-like isoform X2 [Odontomachus brunneus]
MKDKSPTNVENTVDSPAHGPTVKNPIILLERCDKIWETLQLIKGQYTSPIIEGEDEEKEKKEKKVALLNMTFPIKGQRRLTNDSKTPFFSVQKTRRLYPCVTCGKQYLEKRSLRSHSLRLHGIIIPVKHRRTTKLRTVNTQGSNILSSERNSNSDKVHNDNSHEKMVAGKSGATKLAPIFTHSKILQNVSDVNPSKDRCKNIDSGSFVSKTQYSKCALCRQEVKCVKKHLINYHKIGCSANMLKQLEMSLLIEDKSSPSSSKPTLKDILSGKPPQASVNKGTQNKSHIASNEDKTRETSQVVPQKRKYTLSYISARKRLKLNNGRYVPVQKTSKIAQGQVQGQRNVKNKCDICLGVYANSHNLAKHKRIHTSRGETKENFHNFVCNYFNSPLSKRYQQARSSVQSTDTENRNNSSSGNLQSSNPKPSQEQRASRAATHNTSKEDTTCLCGRSFRNHLILRAHKEICKSYKQKDKEAQHSTRDEYSSDRDSGIGINITIKKRNNSYEIVGKDGEEFKQIEHDPDGILSLDVSHDVIKEATNVDARQKRRESNASKYSKDHSVLKLQDADEDLIVDIEEDAYLLSKQKMMQKAVQRNDCSQMRQDDDAASAKGDNTLENVRSLKQMCEAVLKKFTTFQKSETENAPTHPEKKARPVNTSHRTTKKEQAKSGVSTMNFNLTTCAYCNKHFGTVNLYNKHQCTVEEGRRFDEYSLNLLCFSCNATLDSCTQFDEHMKNKHHTRGSYYCYLCPKKFWQKKARNKHISAQHDTSCRFCHMNVPLWIINLHESYHLGFGYPCHKCKKAYSSKKNLSYHAVIHKNNIDTMEFCTLCLKSFKPKVFQSHLQSHDSKKCYFCDKEFNDRAATEYHTLIYHGGAFSKIKCNKCGMRYLTKKQLEQHKNTAGCDRLKRIKEKNML